MTHKHISIIFAAIIIAAAFLQGCTMIGYGIGVSIDRHSADFSPKDTVSIFHDLESSRGRMTRIRYRDSVVFAKFLGDSSESDSSYRGRFTDFASNTSNSRVGFMLGDSVAVTQSRDGRTQTSVGRIQGFYPALGHVERVPRDKFFRYSEIDSLNKIGSTTRLSRGALIALIEANALPVQGLMRFQSNDRQFTLTNSDFKSAFVSNTHRGAITGAVLGALVDIGLCVALLSNIHINTFHSVDVGGNSGGSGVGFDPDYFGKVFGHWGFH